MVAAISKRFSIEEFDHSEPQPDVVIAVNKSEIILPDSQVTLPGFPDIWLA